MPQALTSFVALSGCWCFTDRGEKCQTDKTCMAFQAAGENLQVKEDQHSIRVFFESREQRPKQN
jgi:hypothetical protein